jgi:sugar O-acyltransferase (sialic acid O-acetyltransferase NeuD family)
MVVADAAALSGWTVIDFFDDGMPPGPVHGSWAVVGDAGVLYELVASGGYQGVVVAIGDNATRLRVLDRLLKARSPVATVVHPTAAVSPSAELGVGSVVCAMAVVNPRARLDRGAIVNTGASVDHDCCLGAGVHVSPGGRLGGGVVVGARTWVGIGASVRQNVTIGDDVVVGAGAVVVGPIASGLTAVGCPAKPIRR